MRCDFCGQGALITIATDHGAVCDACVQVMVEVVTRASHPANRGVEDRRRLALIETEF